MSTTTRNLRMIFSTQSADQRTLTVPNPKANLDQAAVSAAMTTIVENGDAFADALTSALKGELVETTRTVLVDNT